MEVGYAPVQGGPSTSEVSPSSGSAAWVAQRVRDVLADLAQRATRAIQRASRDSG